MRPTLPSGQILLDRTSAPNVLEIRQEVIPPVKWASIVFTIASLIILASGSIPFITPSVNTDTPVNESPLFLLAVALVFLSAGIGIVLGPGNTFQIGLLSALLLAFLAIAGLSTLNADLLSLSLRRFISFVGLSILGFYMAKSLGLKQGVKAIFLFTFLLSLLNILAVLTIPGDHISSAGEWEGILSHKNNLGRFSALGGLTALYALVYGLVNRAVAFAALMCALTLLWMSDSATALVVFMVIGSLVFLLPLIKVHKSLFPLGIFIGFVVAGLLSVWVWSSWDVVLASLGRDTTLTGRTFLWPAVWEAIQEKPLLGYGYRAFWVEGHSPAVEVWRQIGWQPKHAHMGYLELWLELGIVALLLFFLLFAFSIGRATRLARIQRDPIFRWVIVYLTFLFLTNVSESTLLIAYSPDWTLFVFILASLDMKQHTMEA